MDPEADNPVRLAVFMGSANLFLKYDPSTRRFTKTAKAEVGTYRVYITLTDVRGRVSEYYVDIIVRPDPVEEKERDINDDYDFKNVTIEYLDPVIKSISTMGEMIIEWDRDMILPDN